VAVDAWRRHERRDAVEQLQPRRREGAGPARAGVGARVEKIIAIDVAQPFRN